MKNKFFKKMSVLLLLVVLSSCNTSTAPDLNFDFVSGIRMPGKTIHTVGVDCGCFFMIFYNKNGKLPGSLKELDEFSKNERLDFHLQYYKEIRTCKLVGNKIVISVSDYFGNISNYEEELDNTHPKKRSLSAITAFYSSFLRLPSSLGELQVFCRKYGFSLEPEDCVDYKLLVNNKDDYKASGKILCTYGYILKNEGKNYVEIVSEKVIVD